MHWQVWLHGCEWLYRNDESKLVSRHSRCRNLTPWPTHKAAACRCSVFLIKSSMHWIFSMFDFSSAFLHSQPTAKYRSFERTHHLYCHSHRHHIDHFVNNKFSTSASFACSPLSHTSALQMCTRWSSSPGITTLPSGSERSAVITLWFVPFRVFSPRQDTSNGQTSILRANRVSMNASGKTHVK